MGMRIEKAAHQQLACAFIDFSVILFRHGVADVIDSISFSAYIHVFPHIEILI
jgi:hypothetical protein